MALVLRKSYGSWSAGTPIEFVEDIGEWATGMDLKVRHLHTVRTLRRVPVEFEHIQAFGQFGQSKSIITKKDHAEFDVAVEDIVALKDKNGVAAKNRKQRRNEDAVVQAKRIAFEGRI